MGSADGDRIAPVTYLFGARAQGDVEAAIPTPSAEPALSSELPRGTAQAHGTVESHGTAQPPGIAQSNGTAQPPATARGKGAEPSKGSFDRISNVSMYALARRGMSSREMRDYLVGREFESAEVDEEIDRLESVALLDDAALAETLIRTLQSRKGLGRSALTAELRRRNIEQLAIESALTVLDDDDELDRAIAIAVKRAGQLRSLDATTAKRRLGDFLMRRGYSGSVVSKAVQHALAPTGPTFR